MYTTESQWFDQMLIWQMCFLINGVEQTVVYTG
jgi:hypothetical protein